MHPSLAVPEADSRRAAWLQRGAAASGKFLALRDLLCQCGLVSASVAQPAAAEEEEEQEQAGGGAAAGGADGAGSSGGAISSSDDSSDSDDDDGGGASSSPSSSAPLPSGGGAVSSQKFLLFAQHRKSLDAAEAMVLRRFFPGVTTLRIDGGVPAAQRFGVSE